MKKLYCHTMTFINFNNVGMSFERVTIKLLGGHSTELELNEIRRLVS